ncbi:ADP-ribosylation factor-binding protein GGA3 isoform X2 [Latimeria chalumnae]|uniref:ADP-ribosylation factor-binding protein GGA3 isoform X2 n=1 Tax=Latimeria chalumnae TaxID=7897 RepID=UPI00313B9832
MAEAEGETLESWLNKATNPCNRQEDWEYIIGFCDQINKELEGPQIAVRLLAHKIQSPQEWEAVQALTVLEACMKNCGRRFHNEVAKFRFLNELIKVVSPKYLGDRVSEKVKTKVIELLYSWTLALPEEPKIKDAYQMLKRQGIVLADPLISIDRTLIPSPPHRPKNPVFEDEEKSKLLAKLLSSKNPDDLQEANKLIKSMVKEDEARMQKVTKRLNTLEEVNNNVKLLNEMLAHYNKEESSEGDKELMKELYERCEKMRRTLFKLASETEDNDNSLGDILQASDDLSRVINSYKKIIEGQTINGEINISGNSKLIEGIKKPSNTETLIDLVGLDVSNTSAPLPIDPVSTRTIPVLPPPPQVSGLSQSRSRSASQSENPANSISLLDEELLCLGLNDPAPSTSKQPAGSTQWNTFQTENSDLDFLDTKPLPGISASSMNPLLQKIPQTVSSFPASAPLVFSLPHNNPASSNLGLNSAPFLIPNVATPSLSTTSTSAPAFSRLQELDSLGQKALTESKGASIQLKPTPVFSTGAALSATVMPAPLIPPRGVPAAASINPVTASSATAASVPALGSPVFRSLSPQQSSPLKGTEISLANISVPLETIKPSNVLPVTAYDKNGFRVLLHFAKECPPGRPDVLVVVVSMINTAPLPIKNIELQAAVPKEKVRLRYKLTFTLGEQLCTELGEVESFPPVETWGNL